MRVALYARFSSDNQRDASIEDQLRLCREHAAKQGWQIADSFADRAISGATMLRPGIQELLTDAERRRFDVVLAESLDRLSRDQSDVAAIYKRLKFADIQIITLAEGEITELHVGLKGTMNALFLKDLADKTRRGLRGRVDVGRSGGGNCYGYDVVHCAGAGGEIERGARRINPAQATIIVRIFEEFAAGRSPRAISFDLNAEGIPSPSGRGWGPSTIYGNATRGTGILNNELYIGRLIWNRLRFVKDPHTGRRNSRLNDTDSIIVKEVPELAIVPTALWEAVKKRQQSVKKNTRPDADKPLWERRRPQYLLSGLMKCGCCAGSYVKISKDHFGCATARNKGASLCTNMLTVRRDVIEAKILDSLQHRLMEPERFKVFMDEFIRELNQQQAARSADATSLKAELAGIAKKIDNLVDAIADGADALPLNAKIKAMEIRQQEIERQLAVMPTTSHPRLHPNLAEIYRAKVAELRAALDAPNERHEAMDVIRGLIQELRLIPENGILRFELYGELAGILALCEAKSSKARREDAAGLAEQIKLVAGAGFEPAAFRL